MKSGTNGLKTGILLIVTAFLCIQFAGFAQVVDILDSGLQQAIRVALDKPEGDITVEDMERLTEWDRLPRRIQEDLENFDPCQRRPRPAVKTPCRWS